MFVGGHPGDYGGHLQRLETLLIGYAYAIQTHQIGGRAEDFPSAFSEYLKSRFAWSLECGFAHAIRSASKTDEEAWRQFWKLAKEFREAMNPR